MPCSCSTKWFKWVCWDSDLIWSKLLFYVHQQEHINMFVFILLLKTNETNISAFWNGRIGILFELQNILLHVHGSRESEYSITVQIMYTFLPLYFARAHPIKHQSNSNFVCFTCVELEIEIAAWNGTQRRRTTIFIGQFIPNIVISIRQRNVVHILSLDYNWCTRQFEPL